MVLPITDTQARPPEIDENHRELAIRVVFTTVSGTLAALQRAEQLASLLGARIRVLVPEVVPYPLALDQPRVAPFLRVRPLCSLAAQYTLEVHIDVRLCRDALVCVKDSLPRGRSTIVIGGRTGWFRRETRLARKLRGWGHDVIFVSQK